MSNDTQAAYWQAQNSAAHLDLTARILQGLVVNGTLPAAFAAAIVRESRGFLDPESPYQPAWQRLVDLFPELRQQPAGRPTLRLLRQGLRDPPHSCRCAPLLRGHLVDGFAVTRAQQVVGSHLPTGRRHDQLGDIDGDVLLPAPDSRDRSRAQARLTGKIGGGHVTSGEEIIERHGR